MRSTDLSGLTRISFVPIVLIRLSGPVAAQALFVVRIFQAFCPFRDVNTSGGLSLQYTTTKHNRSREQMLGVF